MDNKSSRVFLGPVLESAKWWWRWWSTIITGKNNPLRINAFFIFWWFGIIGSICIDWDHFFTSQFQRIRPFHVEILLLVWGLYFCYNSHLIRRLYKTVLRKHETS